MLNLSISIFHTGWNGNTISLEPVIGNNDFSIEIVDGNYEIDFIADIEGYGYYNIKGIKI